MKLLKNLYKDNKIKVLVIGQTPPPYGGQAISIQQLINAKFDEVELYHIQMKYSKRMYEVGKIRIKKFFHLIEVVLRSIFKIIKYKIDIIYYPPGSNKIALIRDIFTLMILRLFKKKIILAFHAAGLSEEVKKWNNPVLIYLFRKAFLNVDAAIQTSAFNPPDADFIAAKRKYIVYPGVRDEYYRFNRDIQRESRDIPTILYVGVITPVKGINILLRSLKLLKDKRILFKACFVGEFVSEEYKKAIENMLKEFDLNSIVTFSGPKIGDEKWYFYKNADIFCFPSFAPFESFGKVVVEAMMFELPVVATRWRGIQEIVVDNETGYLVEPYDSIELAEKIEILIRNKDLRLEMGKKGRKRYLEHFTEKHYLDKMKEIFIEIATKNEG